VRERVAAGALAEVLPGFMPPAIPVHLVYAQARLVAPKIRAFLDEAAPRIEAALRLGRRAPRSGARAGPARTR
jgi:DNA-binding transcriptional LysR family regulator